jgi:hypothetical protein
MGTVTASTEENWQPGYGTVPYSGQNVNRGDVALIRVSSPRSSAGSIYVGGPNSSTSVRVKRLATRSPIPYTDVVCTGGSVSGELCDYFVNAIESDVWYMGGVPGVWARHVVQANRDIDYSVNRGKYVKQGDSGGPVYKYISGGVEAVGIISGSSEGSLYPFNFVYFTDIWDAYWGLPGTLATS